MTNQTLVAGRLRSPDGKLSFTPAVPIDELMKALASKLPVDKIFFVQVTEDGTYAFQEAGALSLDIIPTGTSQTPTVLPPTPPVPVRPANEAIRPFNEVSVSTPQPQVIPEPVIQSKNPVSKPKKRDPDSKLRGGMSQRGAIQVIKAPENYESGFDLFANAKRQIKASKAV